MSKLDKIKEEIGWLKVWLGIFAAADLSVLAWMAQNFEAAKPVLASIALGAIVLLSIVVYRLQKRAKRMFKQLEKL